MWAREFNHKHLEKILTLWDQYWMQMMKKVKVCYHCPQHSDQLRSFIKRYFESCILVVFKFSLLALQWTISRTYTRREDSHKRWYEISKFCTEYCKPCSKMEKWHVFVMVMVDHTITQRQLTTILEWLRWQYNIVKTVVSSLNNLSHMWDNNIQLRFHHQTQYMK
jgi:hypothetical protein